MRFKCVDCGKTKEMNDEDVQKILDMHKTENEEKDKNFATLTEVVKAVQVLEEQMKILKTNVKGLEGKIKESDEKINEEITIS